jgi:hypothetical protein
MSIKDFIVKQVLLTYVKGFLDKMPGNGYKTFIGIVLLALGTLFNVLPEYQGFLSPVMDFLKQLNPVIVQDANIASLVSGFVLSIVGLFHKDLKTQAHTINGLPPAAK